MSLLRDIESACRRNDIPPSTFGRCAVRDPRLIEDIRRGRTVGPALRHQIISFISTLPKERPMTIEAISAADRESLFDLASRCSDAELEAEIERARDALHDANLAQERARIRLDLLVEASSGVAARQVAA